MEKAKIKYTLLHGRRTCGVKEAPSRRREVDSRETEWRLASVTLPAITVTFARINAARDRAIANATV